MRGADAVPAPLFHLFAVPWPNEVLPHRKPVSHQIQKAPSDQRGRWRLVSKGFDGGAHAST